MTRRYELTDEGFALIADLLPPTDEPGGRWNDHRTTLNGIPWALHTGARWREVPRRYGPRGTVYGRFRRWRADGTFDRILERLHPELNDRGLIDNDLWCVDATSIRASRAAAGGGKGSRASPEDHALGRSRGGFGTKLHLVVDGHGIPLSAVVTAGRAHESKSLEGSWRRCGWGVVAGAAPGAGRGGWPATRGTATPASAVTCGGAASGR
jgi:transposase